MIPSDIESSGSGERTLEDGKNDGTTLKRYSSRGFRAGDTRRDNERYRPYGRNGHGVDGNQPRFSDRRNRSPGRTRFYDRDKHSWSPESQYKNKRDDFSSSGPKGSYYRGRLGHKNEYHGKQDHKLTEAYEADDVKSLQDRLRRFEDVEPIANLKVIGSSWGIKPKGFEDVSAQRAKLSGLFPLPGYPRPVDFTKLEGAVKDRLLNNNDILREGSRIDSIDAKVSRTVLVNNNFEVLNYLKVVEFLNDFLKEVDVNERELENVSYKRKSSDDQLLIIEFKHSVLATIIMALDGIELNTGDFKEDNITLENPNHISKLKFERPGEYVAYCPPNGKEDTYSGDITQGPRTISLVLTRDVGESELLDSLNGIKEVKRMKHLRKVGTKESLRLAFVEFDLSINDGSGLSEDLDSTIRILNDIEFIKKASFVCRNPKNISIQEGNGDLNTLKELVKGEKVSAHPKSRVMQLINVVTAKDLMDDDNFKSIEQDIKRELSRFGHISSIRIPRPANDYTPGLSQFNQPGLGKIFVEFESEETALNAIMGIAGRSYNERTVICAYFDFEDYKRGIF